MGDGNALGVRVFFVWRVGGLEGRRVVILCYLLLFLDRIGTYRFMRASFNAQFSGEKNGCFSLLLASVSDFKMETCT